MTLAQIKLRISHLKAFCNAVKVMAAASMNGVVTSLIFSRRCRLDEADGARSKPSLDPIIDNNNSKSVTVGRIVVIVYIPKSNCD